MADAPSPPFNLRCPWCEWLIVVNARGMRRGDPGAGVEAANLMQEHAAEQHDKTWEQFIALAQAQPAQALRKEQG